MLEGLFEDAGEFAQQKHDKTAIEKALAPAVKPGNDGGEPQPYQQRRPGYGETQGSDPVVHTSAPPIENG